MLAGSIGLLAGLTLGLASYTAVGFASTLWQIVRAAEDVRAIVHPYVLMMALICPEHLASVVLAR